mmetsp:Transcript_38308/g.62691  ORF Transcript_38308/g.62691 Transcript_38308/m.62691 type:complete len:320 (-) Transcript_38308:76-1035(-)
MMVANATFLLSLVTNWSMAYSYNVFTKASVRQSTRYYQLHRQSIAFASAFSPLPAVTTHPRASSSLAATTPSKENDQIIKSDSPIFWRARQDCWRPDVPDVEKISWGMPAKKKGTGSRGVPHRLNEDERRSFDQARRQGFLQVTGSSWRSQRADSPLLNSYRSLMDARGRPMVVLHKLSPNSSGGVDNGDQLVVDLSPLRLPNEFEKVGRELKERVLTEFGVGSLMLDLEDEDIVEIDDDTAILDSNTNDDDDDNWGTRPLYQLPPHSLSWEMSRQQGKQIGKFLGLTFDNVEKIATSSKKPKGVKPGKGRRHGGYGIG